ncbi:MAG: group 1 truncated hemoglobin [Undibacterium umbellatum]|uniref:group I truncated hemoglobin n=1 Tax=Undibacterium umbellatum TaxID=2762300 RepID=UPI003BB76918
MKIHTCILVTLLTFNTAVYAQSGPASLFQDLGSEAGISQIVDESLLIILQDERIKASFKETNIPRLAQLLKEQFCVISAGPCKYTGDDMKTVHQGLGINAAQFYAMAEDVQIAMDRLAIPPATQNRLMAKLAPMKRDIVLPQTRP